MRNFRRIPARFVTIALTLGLSSGYAIAGAPACASIAEYPTAYFWYTFINGNADGTFALLSQTASGHITGGYSGGGGSIGFSCADSFNVTGQANGNGQFSISGTDQKNPPGPNCAATFTGTATVSDNGCATGSIVWQNSLGKNGTDTMKLLPATGQNTYGLIPYGETSYAYGVLKSQPATMVYAVTIEANDSGSPSNLFNFQGRTWIENFPDPISNNCTKNPRSPILNNPPTGTGYPTVNSTVTEALPINGISSGYDDAIGLNVATVQELRMLGDAPCSFTVTQLVGISTDQGFSTFTDYQTNTNTVSIGETSITTWRNGVEAEWQYLTPVATGQGILLNLLLNGTQ